MYNNTQFKNTVLATHDISIKSCKINCSYNDKIRDKIAAYRHSSTPVLKLPLQ